MAKRVAVTVTMADCETWLEDWIAHHLHVAERLFIWVDHPSEFAFAEQMASDRVSVLPGRQIDHASRLTQTLTRQDANTNAAIQMAAMAGINWLVHVDADELLVVLEERVWDSDVDQLVFPNHECIPVWQSKFPLRELTRFRVNGQHKFLLYDNGKAALRLGPPPVAAQAHGPHRFSGVEAVQSSGAVVLHYALPGFDHWWRKYERLGAFSDFWFERPGDPIPRSFHTHSRDKVTAAIQSADRTEAEDYYRQHMEIGDEEGLLNVRRDASGRVNIL